MTEVAQNHCVYSFLFSLTSKCLQRENLKLINCNVIRSIQPTRLPRNVNRLQEFVTVTWLHRICARTGIATHIVIFSRSFIVNGRGGAQTQTWLNPKTFDHDSSYSSLHFNFRVQRSTCRLISLVFFLCDRSLKE